MQLFGKSKKKILIIDDDAEFQSMYKVKLEKEGYSVVQCLSGVNVLEIVKTSKPDLILLDIMMPDMDGVKVLNNLKTDQNAVQIPVIMLTNIENKAMDCLKLGAIWYLVKANTDISELLIKIKSILGA